MDAFTFKGHVRDIRAVSPALAAVPLSKIYELCARAAKLGSWNVFIARLPSMADARATEILSMVEQAAAIADDQHRQTLVAEGGASLVPIKRMIESPRRHKSLPAGRLARVQRLWAQLGDEVPGTEANFIEDLQRDLYPDFELKIWEAIAQAMTCVLQDRVDDAVLRHEAYELLLKRSLGDRHETMASDDAVLSGAEAHALCERFDELVPSKCLALVLEKARLHPD